MEKDTRLLSSFLRRLYDGDTRTDNEKDCKKSLCLFLLAWFILWSVLPLVFLKNSYIDPLENIVWGRHFQFGYDKNPYFGAWFNYFFYCLAGKGLWVNYFLSQLCVGIGLLCVWSFAKDLFKSERIAFILTLILTTSNIYSDKSVEFRDDVLELALWPMVMLFLYRALTTDHRWRYWLLTGLCAGLALMTKYYAVMLFVSCWIVVLGTREGRASLRTLPPYVALLIFIALVAPNIVWLCQNDFVAIRYIFNRTYDVADASTVAVTPMAHVLNPLNALNRMFMLFALPLIVYAVLFGQKRKGRTSVHSHFNTVYILMMTWCVPVLSLLFSVVSGGDVHTSWLLPCLPFFTVFLFYFWPSNINPLKFKAVIVIVIVSCLIFGSVFGYKCLRRPYVKNRCDYQFVPGQALADFAEKRWLEVAGPTTLPLVIADRELSCNISVYAKSEPEAYFDANPEFSQWIDESEIKNTGAFLIWRGNPKVVPMFVTRLLNDGKYPHTPIRTATFERAVPGWYVKMTGKHPKNYTVSYTIIYPGKKGME